MSQAEKKGPTGVAVAQTARIFELSTFGGLDIQLERNARAIRDGGKVFELTHLEPRDGGLVPLLIIIQDEVTYETGVFDRWLKRKKPPVSDSTLVEGLMFDGVPHQQLVNIVDGETLANFLEEHRELSAESIETFEDISRWVSILDDHRPGVESIDTNSDLL